MIYFDNAATTFFKPQPVVDAVTEALRDYSLNPHRGTSKKTVELEQKIADTRRKIAILVGADDNKVVFCNNCTAALNLAILGCAKRGGHVVTTATEHNSVNRPLWQLKKAGIIDVTVVSPDREGDVTADAIGNALKNNTYMVIVNQVSNVTGKAQNVSAIGNMLRRHNVRFLVDGAQSVGYLPIDLKKDNVDFVAIPSHKGLHGIQGCGCLAFRGEAPRPILYGGTGTESNLLSQPQTVPDGLEAGTLPCPAILALSAAIDWWAQNFEQNAEKVDQLNKILFDGLNQLDVNVYSKPNKCGIAAFNVSEIDSAIVGDMLGEKDVIVRGGLHCAPLMHRCLNTSTQGAVRVSLCAQNTKEEIWTFLNVLEDVKKRLNA